MGSPDKMQEASYEVLISLEISMEQCVDMSEGQRAKGAATSSLLTFPKLQILKSQNDPRDWIASSCLFFWDITDS